MSSSCLAIFILYLLIISVVQKSQIWQVIVNYGMTGAYLVKLFYSSQDTVLA